MNSRGPDELLTAQQVADELQGRVTVRTVTEWCATGKLPALRAGRKWLVTRRALEAFLRAGGGDQESTKKAEALAA